MIDQQLREPVADQISIGGFMLHCCNTSLVLPLATFPTDRPAHSQLPATRKLPANILGQLWPSTRVVLGLRVCKALREILIAHVSRVDFHVKATEKQVSDDAVLQDLTRFCHGNLRVAFHGMRLPRPLAKTLFAAILRSPPSLHRGIFHLALENCGLGDAGARDLAARINGFTELQHLNLNGFDLGDEGVTCLTAALIACKQLSHLDLRNGRIGAVGAVRLAGLLGAHGGRLRSLSLRANLLGPDGAGIIAAALPRAHVLTHLDVRWNGIRDHGAAQLAEVLPTCSSLAVLALSSNGIGDLGAVELARALAASPQLVQMDLESNVISDRGATALASALSLTPSLSLAHLTLAYNGVGFAGAAVMQKAMLQRSPRPPHVRACVLFAGNAGAEEETVYVPPN